MQKQARAKKQARAQGHVARALCSQHKSDMKGTSPTSSDDDFDFFLFGDDLDAHVYLKSASEEHKSDRDFVLMALKQNGLALKYASEMLRADREMVFMAHKQGGLALQFASAELRADREITLAALRQHGYALEFASKELEPLWH